MDDGTLVIASYVTLFVGLPIYLLSPMSNGSSWYNSDIFSSRFKYVIEVSFGIACVIAAMSIIRWMETQYYGIGMGLPLSTSSEPHPLFNLALAMMLIGMFKILFLICRRLV